jgi:hypothetical protein
VTEPDQPSSPFARRGFIAAGLVVALLVIAGLVVAFTGDDDSSTPRAGGSTAATASPSASASSSNSSGCDQPVGDQLPPVAAPTNEWELVGKLVAPTDPDGEGPGRTATNGLRSCFSHDPTGALFASVNWLGTTSDADQLALALDSLTAPGPGRDAMANMLASDPSAVIGDGGYQVAGFTFLTYTGDVAMLNLAVDVVGGQQAALPMTLQWSGSDWLVQLPADGKVIAGLQILDSLTGYVTWSGA